MLAAGRLFLWGCALLTTNLLAATVECSDSANSLLLGCILQKQIVRMVYVIQFILALSYVSGWGFIIAAIFKFKQVRENPTQVPVSTPFAFLLTAILLIFLPGFIKSGGSTLFVGNHNDTTFLDGTRLGRNGLNFLSTSKIDLTEENTGLGDDTTIFGMIRRTTDMFPTLTQVIINCAYIAGLGFAVAGLFKMKSVRDNPQQNTIAGPISYLIVSILLIYMLILSSPPLKHFLAHTTRQTKVVARDKIPPPLFASLNNDHLEES